MVLNFSDIPDVEFGEDAKAGACELLLNLRSRGSSMNPVGQMLPFAVLDANERLLTMHRTAEGVNLITYSAGTVKWHGTLAGDAYSIKGVAIGSLTTEPRCAEALGDFVVLGCDSGNVYLHYDGAEYAMLDTDTAVPHIRLTAEDAGIASAVVARCEFANGGYTRWQSPLSAEDAASITAGMRSAYSGILQQATARSTHLQPVMARYAVRLHDDSFLWVSQPMIIGNGVQCGAEYRAEVETDGTACVAAAACEITGQTYRIAAEATRGFDRAWDKLIKSIDILVTDEVQPFTSSRSVDYRCETTTTGSRKQYLMMKFTAKDTAVAVRELVGSNRWRVAYQIVDFTVLRAGRAKLLEVAAGIVVDDAELARCTNELSRRRCFTAMLPHGRRMFGCGDMVKLRSGWASETLVNVDRSRSGSFGIVVATRLSTARGAALTVWHDTGSGQPLSINPMVAYPDARATSVTVTVRSDSGQVKTFTAQLQPAHKAGYAYMVSCDLLPIVLEDTGLAVLNVPDEVNVRESVAGTLVESTEMNPIVAKTSHSVCDGRIIALGASPHHSNNAIGTPLYAFATSGVYALPYRTATSAYAPAVIISRHLIATDAAPVNTLRKLCFATTDGKLCTISDYKTEVVRRDVGSIHSMIHDMYNDELWLAGTGYSLTVVTAGGLSRTRSEKFAQLFASSAGEPVAIANTGAMYRIGREVGNLVDVELLTHPFSPDDGAGKFVPTEFSLNINAKNCNLEIEVLGDNGISCHGMMLCRLRLKGDINSPVRARLVSPPLRKMRVAISGKLPTEAVIGAFEVCYNSH